jgi:hypothetical protein
MAAKGAAMGIYGTAAFFAMVFGALALYVVWRWKGSRRDPWRRAPEAEPPHIH